MSIRQGQANYMAADVERWTSQMIMWESAIMYRLKGEKLLPSIDCVVRDAGMEAGGHVEGQGKTYYLSAKNDNIGCIFNALILL